MGSDVAAACGQLVVERKEKSTGSGGRGGGSKGASKDMEDLFGVVRNFSLFCPISFLLLYDL